MRKTGIALGIFSVVISALCLLRLPLFADTQNLTVTGIVVPHATDFQLAIDSNITGTIPQGTVVTYTITYGSQLDYADHITLEADWLPGTVYGNSSPSIDGMDYITGSAGKAYGTSPIVNLSNQSITWSLPSLPAHTTSQTVSFQLITNGSYTGAQTVDFPVKVRLLASNFTKPFVPTSITYQFDSSLVTPTPTPTPPPTPTPTPGTSSGSSSISNPTPTAKPAINTTTTQSVTPQPTSPPQSLSNPQSNAPVQNVSVVNVSDSTTQIAVSLNRVKSATVVYGLSPTGLTNTSSLDINGYDGTINLDSLDAGTTYYMQLITTGSNGRVTKSEVFAVQTAQTSAQPQVATASLVVASDNDVLYSAGLNQSGNTSSLNKTPQIPVAQDTNYTFAFKLTKVNKIKNVSMTLKNTSVLGISNFQTRPLQPLQYSFPVTQTGNGVYSVQIKNPTTPGTYDVFVRITDFDGNVTTQKVAAIRVLKPFRVYNATSRKPIEDARILIYRLDTETNRYELLPNFGGTGNPLFTNTNGEVSESLPKGTYKANFGRVGYEGQDNVAFSLGTTPKDDFPTVYLKPTAITPLSVFIYYRNAFTDYVGATTEYVGAIQQSYRYFDLIGLLIIFSFIIVGFLLFKMKSHIALSHIPYYLHHHTLGLFGNKSPYMNGTVIDTANKHPISGAYVSFIDERTNRVVLQMTTTKNGAFLARLPESHYSLVVMKDGYEPSENLGYSPEIVVRLTAGEALKRRLRDVVVDTVENSLALFFEYILVTGLILEIVLFPAFGLIKTVPFMLASILNIILWIFYLRERGKEL